ncbi:MAG: hypothetical protein HY064_00910 [Bacteroidetes bacterium]|nr:hypothetical protein [Bacteroidota bacterium]
MAIIFFPQVMRAQSVREQIDADRRSLSYEDEKTLEKAREFIRMDTSYYVGYMYMGAFHFYRANDKLGFTQVVVPLSNAMRLMEKEFDAQLRTRTNDLFSYLKVSPLQNDYCTIAYWLEQSYQNIDEPDKAFAVLEHVRDKRLQYENGIDTYNTMAWIYHRNRVYTSKNFKFLKNSVAANDSVAMMYLDSAITTYQQNAELNVGIFDATFINQQYLYVYHYKAILFDYKLNIDSANYYYDILLRTGYYSSNNYAEFKYALGDFKTADDYFHEAEQREGTSEKRTREFYYMRGNLDEFRARPDLADTLLSQVIEKQGSTPGFGWHSIGLARALYYEGLTAESEQRNIKAQNFDELHISTTWGKEQYNLAVMTLNYSNQLRFEREYLFENDQWYFWFNPVNWWKLFEYSVKNRELKLVLASMVAANPERAQVIYPIFSSENLINFDEVWTVIDGFGTDYFIKFYSDLLEKDKRPLIKKYYKYFLGKLYASEGDNAKALDYFNQVLDDPDIDDEYNKLLYARACEGIALTTSNADDRYYYTRKMYEAFPQLVPFSDVKMKFNLDISNDINDSGVSAVGKFGWFFGCIGLLGGIVMYYLVSSGRVKIKMKFVYGITTLFILFAAILIWGSKAGEKNDPASNCIRQLKECSIDFSNRSDVPVVHVEFDVKKDGMDIHYSVEGAHTSAIGDSNPLEGSFHVEDFEYSFAGKLLAYHLFGIQKSRLGGEYLVDDVDAKMKKIEKADSVK